MIAMLVRPQRVELRSPGYQPGALPLSYGRVAGVGIEPTRIRLMRPVAAPAGLTRSENSASCGRVVGDVGIEPTAIASSWRYHPQVNCPRLAEPCRAL